MNENHQRHLLSTFQHVDNLLTEMEHVLTCAHPPLPFQEYKQDSAPAQRKMIRDGIVRVREAMRRSLEELNVAAKPPISGALWAARNQLAFASLAVVEIGPSHMKAYGELSERDEQTLNRIITELNELLGGLDNCLAPRTKADVPPDAKPPDAGALR